MPEVSKYSDSWAHTHLNALRGGAALMVLVSHWRVLLFLDFSALHGMARLLLAPIFLLTDCGHPAVVIFFVLSGYLVSGSLIRAERKGQRDLVSYSLQRLTRLWTVLIPALALGALLDTLGAHSRALPWYIGQVPNNVGKASTLLDLNWRTFFVNAGFLQTIHGDTFGSNVALWSLAYEFWYYVMFPLLFILLIRRTGFGTRVLCGLLLAGVCALVGRPCYSIFPLWLLGVSLHYMPALPDSRKLRCAALLGFGVVFFGTAALAHVIADLTLLDYILGIATTVFLWTLLASRKPSRHTVYRSAANRLSAGSYTLYVIHFPVLLLLGGLLLGPHRDPINAHSMSLGLVILMGPVLVAGVMYKTFEAHTEQVRGFACGLVAWLASKSVHANPHPATKPGIGYHT